MTVTSLLVLFVCQGAPSDRSELEQALRAIANGSRSPSDLSVTYDDMHGLWGGVAITITGQGTYQRSQRDRGANVPQVITSSIDTDQVRELAQLLVDVHAWEQQTEERAPLPDESQASVTVEVGGARVRIWEWFNDLTQNGRLVQIRDRMLAYGDRAG